MMVNRQPGVASWLLSACLHAAVLLCLWLSAAPDDLKTPPPLALELWAGNAGQVSVPVATPAPAPAPAPQVAAKAPPPPPAPVQDNPVADVKVLAGKPASKPLPPETKPAEKAPSLAKSKPEPAKPAPTPPVKSASSVPAKPAANAKPAAMKTDDLLAELDALPPGPGQGKVSQAGAKTGAKTGAANGLPDQKQQYGEAIKNRVRPYIVIPDGIKGNPEASVEVIILPTLEIRSTRILRSSGSAAWDQAVLAALADVRRFPPLPKGADFADYRRITLNFRPKE